LYQDQRLKEEEGWLQTDTQFVASGSHAATPVSQLMKNATLAPAGLRAARNRTVPAINAIQEALSANVEISPPEHARRAVALRVVGTLNAPGMGDCQIRQKMKNSRRRWTENRSNTEQNERKPGDEQMANANTKKQRRDNRSNQKNPNNWRYEKSRRNNN
jgi:hypothetical protein